MLGKMNGGWGGCARTPGGEERREEVSEREGKEAAEPPGREGGESPVREGEEAARSENFTVFSPRPGEVVRSPVRIRGRARVFEGSFVVEIEDGHNLLAREVVQASAGGPEWGEFDLSVEFETPTSPGGTLIFVTYDAADGKRKEELLLPVKFAEVAYPGEDPE